MMKKLFGAAFALLFALSALAQQTGEWTGYITDEHCKKKGATAEHTADCVEKCTKDGSKAQIWNEKDDKPYNLSEFRKVKAYVGQKVTIQGTLDKKTNTIAVETVGPAE
jgi:uncharacterized protein YdeI (BOF family)